MSGIESYAKRVDFVHDIHVIRGLPWKCHSSWTLIWHVKNSAKDEWTAKDRFSIIAKNLSSKFPLEDGGEGIHLRPPPPLHCALYFRGLIVSSWQPATCKVTFSFFRMTHLWETNDNHHLPTQRPSRLQAYAVCITFQLWHEDVWQLFLRLSISASWESFTIFTLSSKRSKNVVCNCYIPLEFICCLHSCNFIYFHM